MKLSESDWSKRYPLQSNEKTHQWLKTFKKPCELGLVCIVLICKSIYVVYKTKFFISIFIIMIIEILLRGETVGVLQVNCHCDGQAKTLGSNDKVLYLYTFIIFKNQKCSIGLYIY